MASVSGANGANVFNTTSGTKVATGTVATGELIVFFGGHTNYTGSVTPTDNQGGEYEAVVSSVKGASVDMLTIYVRTSLIPSGTTSVVLTHAPGTTTGGGFRTLRVSGVRRVGRDAIRQVAAQNNQGGGGGTPTPVFDVPPLASNPIIGAVLNATSPATLTPRASPAYTERGDVGYSTPTTGLEGMSIDSGETGTSIAWGGTSASAFCDAVIEIDTSPPGAFLLMF